MSSGSPTKIERSRRRGLRATCSTIWALVSAARNASRSPPSGIGSTPTKSVSHTYGAVFSSGFSCRK